MADREYQQHVWIDGAPTTRWYTWCFTETYNWLFENLSVTEDPFGCIGLILRDETEARAMVPLKDAVDLLHIALGYNGRTDAEYLASPLWTGVVAAAGRALAALQRPDVAADANSYSDAHSDVDTDSYSDVHSGIHVHSGADAHTGSEVNVGTEADVVSETGDATEPDTDDPWGQRIQLAPVTWSVEATATVVGDRLPEQER